MLPRYACQRCVSGAATVVLIHGSSGWAAAVSTLSHDYTRGGLAAVVLTTRWGATYTITYEGQTFGPYNATGQLTKQQTLALAIDTSSPTLLSQ